MVYRIPPDAVVAKAMNDCLARTPKMHSLRELSDAVSAELELIDPQYRAGPERIRRIGIRSGIITVTISYAESGKETGNRCPVCRSFLVPVRNRTLDGNTVETSKSCPVCGYTAKGTENRPARYEITRTKPVDTEERIGMLKEARRLLIRAAELMDGALGMSGIQYRSAGDSDTVRKIASDPDYGGSLLNLALDLERLEKDPLWTRPFDSPKNESDER